MSTRDKKKKQKGIWAYLSPSMYRHRSSKNYDGVIVLRNGLTECHIP